MNGSIAFLTIKRNMNFWVNAGLDTACFMDIHCKDYLKHK